jgi:diguanylate cyclase (GGDEF)-like protein
MLNEQDVVMRSGNGEFAIFIRGMEQVQNAERLANELIERVERPITVSGTHFRLSASIGITLSPRQSGEWRLLLQDADEAVYDAKKQGRGHISISSGPPRKADA